MEQYNEYLIDLIIRCHNGDDNAIKEYEKLRWSDLENKITFDEVFIKKMYELSEKDNSYALNILGLIYSHDTYTKKDPNKAIELYEKAIEKGNILALCNLGYMYYTGKDIKRDLTKTKKLYEQAIEKGCSLATCALAGMYLRGNGVTQDYNKTIELYIQAIEKGSVNAIHLLATMYYYGYGTDQNYIKSMELFEQAAEKGCDRSIANLALMYQHGKGVSINYTKAIVLYKKFIENNGDNHDDNHNAMANLASIYETCGGYENYMEAIKIYLKLKKKDDIENMIIRIINKNGTTNISDLIKLIYDPQINELYNGNIPQIIRTIRKMTQYYQHEISKTILSCKKIPPEIINKEIIPKID